MKIYEAQRACIWIQQLRSRVVELAWKVNSCSPISKGPLWREASSSWKLSSWGANGGTPVAAQPGHMWWVLQKSSAPHTAALLAGGGWGEESHPAEQGAWRRGQREDPHQLPPPPVRRRLPGNLATTLEADGGSCKIPFREVYKHVLSLYQVRIPSVPHDPFSLCNTKRGSWGGSRAGYVGLISHLFQPPILHS